MLKNVELQSYAKRIALLLSNGCCIAEANDLYNEALNNIPLCRWEQLAFSDEITRLRTDHQIYVAHTEDGVFYRLVYAGVHRGYFESSAKAEARLVEIKQQQGVLLC